MQHTLALILLAVAVIVVVHLLADKTGLSAAVLLTVSGLIYAIQPGPNIALNPDFILTFVIPPLLYSAALNASVLAIRKNLRVVISLSVVLVLATALVVGVGIDQFVPGVGLAAGVALGGAVAPTDPVAALSVGRRAGLPPKLITLIEGEGLLNDATALTTLTVAVSALTSGSFSFGGAALRFLVASAGGLLVGVVVALGVRLVRSVVREPLLVNTISLATPFATYLLGKELHVSGVLAVVVAGLMVGHDTPRFTSGASRLQASAVWRLADFLLEGFGFLLIGQALPSVVRGLSAYPTSTVVIASTVSLGVVLLLRPLWLVLTQYLPRALHTRLGGLDARDERGLSGSEVLVMSWAGTRGVISLAAIFTLPLTTNRGVPIDERDLLLFCTYVVVLVTLVGQGMTFAPVVRVAKLRTDTAGAAMIRNEARAASVDAALVRLDQLATEGDIPVVVLDEIRASLNQRADRYRSRLDVPEGVEDGEIPVSPEYEAAVRAHRAVIDAQRGELLRWRDAQWLPEASLRILERELDHQEHVLPRPRGL